MRCVQYYCHYLVVYHESFTVVPLLPWCYTCGLDSAAAGGAATTADAATTAFNITTRYLLCCCSSYYSCAGSASDAAAACGRPFFAAVDSVMYCHVPGNVFSLVRCLDVCKCWFRFTNHLLLFSPPSCAVPNDATTGDRARLESHATEHRSGPHGHLRRPQLQVSCLFTVLHRRVRCGLLVCCCLSSTHIGPTGYIA